MSNEIDLRKQRKVEADVTIDTSLLATAENQEEIIVLLNTIAMAVVGYSTIQDEGVSLPQENILDFVGSGVTVTAGSGKTIVTINGGSGTSFPYVAKSSSYTATLSDYTIDCVANTFTVTLPSAIGIQGKLYNIKNSGTGDITIAANGVETIDGSNTILLKKQNVSVNLQSTNSGWIII